MVCILYAYVYMYSIHSTYPHRSQRLHRLSMTPLGPLGGQKGLCKASAEQIATNLLLESTVRDDEVVLLLINLLRFLLPRRRNGVDLPIVIRRCTHLHAHLLAFF